MGQKTKRLKSFVKCMSKNSISGKIKKNHDWDRHGLKDLTADGRAQAMRPSTNQLQGISLRWEVRLSQPQSTHRVDMTTFWRAFHHDGKTSTAWRGWVVYSHTHPLSLYLPSRVVYAPAESADTLPHFLLYLYEICGPSIGQ